MKQITLLLLWVSLLATAQPGTIDYSFDTGTGPNAGVAAAVKQPDGKLIIAGSFTSYNGVTRNGIARIEADGSLDLSFDPNAGVNGEVYAMALQPDGKIIIAGWFSGYDGTPRTHIARVNPDGSHDPTFDPGSGPNQYLATVGVQQDGKIIAGGFFTTFNGSSKNRLVRLNADGSVDGTFQMGTGTNEYVYTISVAPDDKIYVGGGFTTYNGANCGHITRLNADGTRDLSFISAINTNNSVLTHAVQPDGKIVIGGYFSSHSGQSRPAIARINPNGSLDTSFTVGTGFGAGYPLTTVVQPDGKILLGGEFTAYNGVSSNNIVRLNPDGTRDAGFAMGTGINGGVYSTVFMPGGKLLVGSFGDTYNGDSTRPYLVQLNGYGANQIFTPVVPNDEFCIGSTFEIANGVDGYYTEDNTFTVQLSDASGSFDSPVSIGSADAFLSGPIEVTIPVDTPPGTGYRMRVVSSEPVFIGEDNGSDLTITAGNVYYADADEDGFGDAASTVTACNVPEGYVENGDDCDDADPAVNPGAVEIPGNGIDDNCDGQIDEGFYTQLKPAYCGATLTSVGQAIGCSSVPTATGYRFEVTDQSTMNVQTIDRTVPNFQLSQLPVYDYSATYSVRVEVKIGGMWVGYYGPACMVNTPDVAGAGGQAQISAAQCGQQIATVSTLIATTSLPGVSTYRFRVTDLTDTDGPHGVQVIDRGLHWFSLTMLDRYNYGTTYQIEVAVKTALGVFTAYGQACTVTTPAVPEISMCGAIVPHATTKIPTTSLLGATSYRFEITNTQTLHTEIIDRPLNWFSLAMVPDLAPSTDYLVRVGVMTKGEYSPFSEGCIITSPGSARNEFKNVSQPFAALAYPNPFADTFGIDISTSSESSVNVKVYDMTGRMLEQKEVAIGEVSLLEIGERFPAGVYNVIVSQGDDARTLRVVKR